MSQLQSRVGAFVARGGADALQVLERARTGDPAATAQLARELEATAAELAEQGFAKIEAAGVSARQFLESSTTQGAALTEGGIAAGATLAAKGVLSTSPQAAADPKRAAFDALRSIDHEIRAADRGTMGSRVSFAVDGLSKIAESVRAADPALAQKIEEVRSENAQRVEASKTQEPSFADKLAGTSPFDEACLDAIVATRNVLARAKHALQTQLGTDDLTLSSEPKSALTIAEEAYRLASKGAMAFSESFTDKGRLKSLLGAAREIAHRVDQPWPEIASELMDATARAEAAPKPKAGYQDLQHAIDRALVDMHAKLPQGSPAFTKLAYFL
ncbi:MAG: hypothetical protein HY791_13020 [Deltaproteobacteria bacterium]|nr:hypothetical protein [Deltaproteobacteria bacterium]